jgi:molecular chaperone IbpA
MKLSGFGSASNVRFFWFCSAVGGVGKPEACPCRPQQFCRRADLSGAFRIFETSFGRRPQTPADYTQGGLTNDSLSYTRKLHHIDGRDLDRLFDLFDQSISDWPPYNIEKTSEDQYRITMTIAGFGANEIELVQHGGTLLVTGQKDEQPELLHQGIPLSFKQSFNLANHVKVVAEELKPRRIEIRSTTEAKVAQQDNQPEQIDIGAQKAA